MNEILGETLHSQKNLFFSMQILVDKIEKQVEEPEKIPEIRRLKGLVAGSLTRVTQMLDELREIKYQYLNNNLLDIIDDAVNNNSLLFKNGIDALITYLSNIAAGRNSR